MADCTSNHTFHNWAQTISCKPASYCQPDTENKVNDLVKQAIVDGKHVRTVGGGHSWAWAEQAGVFFRNLQKKPIPVPIIAILPEAADTELVTSVLAVAEDFLVEPVRKDELALRLNRIIGPQFSAAERVRQTLLTELGLANLVGKHASFLRALMLLLFRKSFGEPSCMQRRRRSGWEYLLRRS